jgi:hypothetical protein
VPDLEFYNAGCGEAQGLRRIVVVVRRALRRVLRPIFAHQVFLYQYLIDRLDRSETAVQGELETLRKRQDELTERVETIQAFGWDYVAMVRRLAVLEDQLADLTGQTAPSEEGQAGPSILFPGLEPARDPRARVS